MINNPIFKKEFLGAARSWKTHFIIAGYLLSLSVLLVALWPSGGVQSVVSSGAKQIFAMFFSVDLLLILLMTPAFSAGAITTERERGTYPALFTTLLSQFDILAGKLLSAVLTLIVIAVLSMPVAAVCALAGGVDTDFMFKMFSILFLTAVSYGILGLACSSICSRTTGAVILNYCLVILFAGATWLPQALLSNIIPGMTGLFQTLRSISPFDAIMFLLYPDSYKLTSTVDGAASGMSPYTVFVIASCAISALAFVIFYRNVLKPEINSKRLKGNVYTDRRTAARRTLTFPFYLFDPLRRKKPIGRFSNPVFVAEMRSKLFSNPKFVMRTVCSIIIISLGLLTLLSFQLGNEIRPDSVRAVAIIFQVGIVALLAPGISSGLITDEITSGTFAALRMTPVSPLTMIIGKLKATFFYALIFIISSVFVLLAMAYLEQQTCFPEISVTDPAFWHELLGRMKHEEGWFNNFWNTYCPIFQWVVILLLSTMTFLTAGLAASAFSKNTTSATALAYIFVGILCVATLLPIPLGEKFPPAFGKFILSFNPLATAMQVTSHSFEKTYPGLFTANVYALAGLNILFLTASVARMCRMFRKQD